MKVQFSQVGRGKKSWEADLPDLNHQTLYGAVKKAGALGSRGIDFQWDTEEQVGMIYVGGFTCVGLYTVPDLYINESGVAVRSGK
jgi:hypothetical protein